MTPDELLRDRYKVIAPYPGIKNHGWEVGDILDRNWCEYQNGDEEAGVTEWQISDCPANFQLLPWWNDRKVEDMPEYVRCVETPDQIIQPGEVLKVNWHRTGEGKVENGQWVFCYTNCYEPATLAEYEAYQQSKIK